MAPMQKGKRYVPRLHICTFTTHTAEGMDRNGRLWRWDFSPEFGPLFLDHKGVPLKVQPIAEKHPAWVPFNEWHATIKVARP